jgi:hypothetical protein
MIEKIYLKTEMSRHSCGNAIVICPIEEGCSKADYNRLMQLANNEKRVFITIEEI